MKLNKLVLTLTAAALLPTFAYAGTDAVVASFERDLHRGVTVESLAVAKAEADPLDIVNNILNKEEDAVVASFERDLYRAPAATQTVLAAKAADPLVEAISLALYGTTDQVLASFERDLYRAPAAADAVMIAGEADPLAAINAALWSEIVKPVVHAALPGSGS
ncbi:MAG: hypothetical protein A3G79_00845 [Gallionellales bacterium RIFCSPLOWO2_12_FULL_57_18]|nr:MAG: hypothetical protein A3G79_00845 [Gallionellales bacterium RIFCSPLOWO2_12_FULL_57_18]OGS97417.1 MAG: hypothetical protein A3H31_00150 [Gallionellales bacterium RIFCSPLOWO2_02_FULL_57_47]OGT17154.1 MAG: hypothetical protein A3J49_12730 [Gallionellales bacterium RIFCSPHIGHO2_02_FULL_57_16]